MRSSTRTPVASWLSSTSRARATTACAPRQRRPYEPLQARLGAARRRPRKLLVTPKEGEPAKVITGDVDIGNTYASSGRGQAEKRTLAFRDLDVSFTGPDTSKVIDRIVEGAGRMKPAPMRWRRSRPWRAPSRRHPVRSAPRRSDELRRRRASPRELDDGPVGRGTQRRARVPRSAPRPVRLYERVAEHALEVTEFAGDARRNEGSMHQKLARFGAKGPVVVGSNNHDDDRRVGQQFDGLVNRMRREGKTRTLDRVPLRRDPLTTKMKIFFLDSVVGRVR